MSERDQDDFVSTEEWEETEEEEALDLEEELEDLDEDLDDYDELDFEVDESYRGEPDHEDEDT